MSVCLLSVPLPQWAGGQELYVYIEILNYSFNFQSVYLDLPREKQTDRCTDRQLKEQSVYIKLSLGEGNRQETDRQIDGKTDRQIDRPWQKFQQPNRQTNKQTNKQTDKQRDD